MVALSAIVFSPLQTNKTTTLADGGLGTYRSLSEDALPRIVTAYGLTCRENSGSYGLLHSLIGIVPADGDGAELTHARGYLVCIEVEAGGPSRIVTRGSHD